MIFPEFLICRGKAVCFKQGQNGRSMEYPKDTLPSLYLSSVLSGYQTFLRVRGVEIAVLATRRQLKSKAKSKFKDQNHEVVSSEITIGPSFVADAGNPCVHDLLC